MEHTKDISQLTNVFRQAAFPGSFFFSFEGIEGSGKSTQIVKIKDYLEDKGFNVIVIREPGGTAFGEKLRQAILTSNTELHPAAEAHLFASARAQNLHALILKELETPNTVVICDRFLDSSIAYQGVARKLGPEYILNIHSSFPLNIVPHKTFYLRIDLEKSLERQRLRNMPKDYFESRDNSFHQDLIEGYDYCAKIFPNRIATIDGSAQLEVVTQKLIEEIETIING
ncbi:dTMP kinase [Halobacteriovorax sp. GFR7]|uniref:dTMP kinase n=1 Tax=unclassified Halobacteriovorax TaxID=2639665 RepID=UPI003D989BCC